VLYIIAQNILRIHTFLKMSRFQPRQSNRGKTRVCDMVLHFFGGLISMFVLIFGLWAWNILKVQELAGT